MSKDIAKGMMLEFSETKRIEILKTKKLNELKQQCKNCTRCELSKSRKNIVFSDGNPETATIVLIGEAPGANEDETGTPFVGRAGKLLNEFLIMAGINREKDLYIINTLKCRPPENRVPKDSEKKMCEKFLISQIEIISPKIILFCGATAMKSFIKEKTTISKIRGQWLDINIENKTYRAMAVFHPSYLLRNHKTEIGSPRYFMKSDLIKVKDYITKN